MAEDVATLAVKVTASMGELQGDLRKLNAAFSDAMGGIEKSTGTANVAIGNLVADGIKALAAYALDAIKDVIALGDTLTNLSASTGVSMDALQEWKYAAEATGSTLDSVTKASDTLGRNLVNNSNDAKAALKELHLSQSDLLKMNPEQRFEAVARAIAAIPDPANRAAVATALLGKDAAANLMPAISNFDKLTDEAKKLGVVIGEDTLRAAGEFGSQMNVLKTQFMAMIAEALAPMMPAIAEVAKALTDIAKVVFPAVVQGVMWFLTGLTKADLGFNKFLRSIAEGIQSNSILRKVLGDQTGTINMLNESIASGEKDLARWTQQEKKSGDETVAAEGAKAGAYVRTGDAADKAREAEQKRLDALSGKTTVAAATQLMKDIEKNGGVARISMDQLDESYKKLIAGINAAGAAADPAMRRMAQAIHERTTESKTAIQSLQSAAINMGAALQRVSFVPTGIKTDPTDTLIANVLGTKEDRDAAVRAAMKDTYGAYADFFTAPLPKLPTTPIANAVRDATKEGLTEAEKESRAAALKYGESLVGTIVGAIQGGGGIGKALGAQLGGDAFTKFFKDKDGNALGAQLGGAVTSGLGKVLPAGMSKALGGIAGAAFPVLGSLAGAALGGVVDKLFGPKESQKVNDMRDQFVSAAGGLDALNVKAHESGKTLDALLKAKTVKSYEAAVADLGKAFTETAAKSAGLVKSMAHVNEAGGVLGADAIKQLAKVKSGTEEGAAAFDFFTAQTQRAASGAATFLENAAVTSQASADALMSSLGAIYEDFRAQGMAPAEAMAALGPAIAGLNKQLVDAGLSGSAAFAQLAEQASLTSDTVAGPLYKAIGGLGDLLGGLANTGRMNQDIFGGLTTQISDTWSELVKMGKGGAAGMALIQPELQEIWELQQDYNYAVDESTQSLLDSARASGLVGEQFRSDQDKMIRAIDRLVERMGALVTALATTLPGAAESGARSVQNALDDIEPPEIEIKYKYVPQNELPGGTSTDGGGPSGRSAMVATPAGVRGTAVAPLRVAVNVDGERIAEAAARYTGRALAPYGIGSR